MSNYTHASTTTAPPLIHRYNDTEKALIILVLLLMTIAATFGNVLTFVAYHKRESLQRPTNYFILSLATADIGIATFVVNFHTVYMVADWPYKVLSYETCLLWLSVDYWLFQVSVFGVICIAGDRYLSIKYPNGYREFRTKKRVIYMIAANWIISFLIWVPLILYFGYKEETEMEMKQKKYCDVGSEKQVPATVIGCLVSYVFPIFLIIGIAIDSVRILMKLKKKFSKHSKSTLVIVNNNAESTMDRPNSSPIATISGELTPELKEKDAPVPMPEREKEKKKKLANTLKNPGLRLQSFSKSIDEYQWIATFNMLLGITFIVNILPFGVLAVTRSVCHAVSGESCVSQEWWYFGYIMCYLNSMLNPVCYAVGNKNFKKAFKELLCRKVRQRRSSTASSTDSVAHLRNGATLRERRSSNI